MAREYGRLHTSFWTSKTIRALSEDGRTLAAYLLSCEHGSIIGAFRLPAAYACDDLGWDVERFKKGFKTLEQARFAIYCRETQWVCIVKYMEWNPAENPNQRIAFNKALSAMPDTCFAEGLRNGSVTVGKLATATATATVTVDQKKPAIADAPAPLTPKPAKPKLQTIGQWLEELGDAEAIPETDAVFDYAAKIGLPAEFLELAWREFEVRYRDSGKRQSNFRQTFANAVRGNWFKLWWESPDGWQLTTTGVQARKAAA